MGLIDYRCGAIKAVYACVPGTIVDNREVASVFSEEEKEQVLGHIGIDQRRVCMPKTCASDLCFEAAVRLMEEQQIAPESIEMLLFVSQSGDRPTPATACSLQKRLGLSKETAALDVVMACSGYVYALSAALAYCACGVKRILVLAGDTPSKIVSAKDRATSLLPGDAGTATLIDAEECLTSISLNTDGGGVDALTVRAGGARLPASEETLAMTSFGDGSERNAHHLEMDGLEVFNFTVREVSKDLKRIFEHCSLSDDEIFAYLFHQANAFILDFILKKRKISREKVPSSLRDFGNTICASIPLTLVTAFGGQQLCARKLLMCGYGGGLSWGTLVTDVSQCSVGTLIIRDDL